MVSRGLLMRSTTAHRCIRKLTTEIDASLPPMGGCPSSVTPSAGMYHNHYPSSYCACSEVMLLGSLLACNPVRSTHVVLSYPAAFRLPAYSFSTVLFFFFNPTPFVYKTLPPSPLCTNVPCFVPEGAVCCLCRPFVADLLPSAVSQQQTSFYERPCFFPEHKMAEHPTFPFANDFSYFINHLEVPTDIFWQDFEDQTFPTVMTPPIRSNGPYMQAEGSFSAPNRKRDFESSTLFAPAGPSKSRRTTPVPSFDPFSSSQPDADGAEFIDLTG